MEPQLPTRTEAYNTLKNFLSIPRNALLNKKFFSFFYQESFDGFVEKMPKEKMGQLIKSYNLVELNLKYHELVEEEGKEDEAQKVKEEIFSRLRKGVEKFLDHPKQEPYFVKQN